jgi:hypothetical protein
MRRAVVLVVATMCCLLVGSCGDDGDEGAPSSDGDTPAETVGDDAADGAVPTRAPEVTGRLAVDDEVVRLAEPSDIYFTEMILVSSQRDDEVLVVDEGGERLAVEDLDDGMLVDVWVGGACAESYPVQCDIEALRIDPAS